MSRAIFLYLCMVCWRGYYITPYYCMLFKYNIVRCDPLVNDCFFLVSKLYVIKRGGQIYRIIGIISIYVGLVIGMGTTILDMRI
jgi:hypothetical protein